MKPIEQIRRENFAALVAAEPSQAAFARKIGKDKNQVSQWLGRAGARNISAETAREIEAMLSKPAGWMDHDHPPTAGSTVVTESQPGGLDAVKLAASIEFLQELFSTWRRPFVAADQAGLIAAVYDELTQTTTPNLVQLSRRVADQLDQEGPDHERQSEARRA
ncbi:helix-turn-helix transcriptional regulator [Lysobacter capsici]|uniref:helix-turn-helix transcriptional regulator n=1 Tax=Lysobacter capsici TaxID=435897 RepID=UPI00287B6824|nr:helix-turn-helix transcriptional regulator [Lysobacter capsici]WND79417.1 helix-turn-helix transcriptional regulator [Lysobacter capsici]WND84613.1 helix-turn-helix transcriptional regulator [Lysobacter capsici]